MEAYSAIQTSTLALHVKWQGRILIPLHTWHYCAACLSEVEGWGGGILHGSFFLMFSVNPVGKLPKTGHHRLWQMENLSKGIMMP